MTWVLAGCASGAMGEHAVPPRDSALVPGRPPVVATETTIGLAGKRCSATGCTCREPGRDDAEPEPPSDGSKRFEVRLASLAGATSLDLSGLGTLSSSDPAETCFYLDLPAGGDRDVRLTAREGTPGTGVAPILEIAEYGPKGPFWYDIITMRCDPARDGSRDRCDRRGAEAWSARMRQRKRGRLDPCGSAVVTRLAWETSGGQSERDGGLFRDLTVTFNLQVKKFATQFAPGSTECVPK